MLNPENPETSENVTTRSNRPKAFRTSVTLRAQDKVLLEQLADMLGLSTSGAIAAAVRIAKKIQDEKSEGNEIETSHKDGTRKKLEFVI